MKVSKIYGKAMIVISAILLSNFTVPVDSYSQEIGQEILSAAQYRAIGPTRQSGRFIDFAVYEKDPSIFYAAMATGGLWKTVNNGITFEPVFDDQSILGGIGAIAIDPNNPDVIWVGSGESNNSRTAYYGDGIYKSVDGGKTWQNMGLKESQHIGRIIVHPVNPDIVWVASPGPLYSDNDVRGVYKTINGGRTWKKVLSVVAHGKPIGAIELAIDHGNPDIIYAATYDKIRKPWTFNHAGPGSGIYKSTDGGDNWNQLTNGLPSGMLGRIGLDVSRSNPNIVYAHIENANIDGVSDEERRQQLLVGNVNDGFGKGEELYRSDDKGETWKKMTPDGVMKGNGIGYYLIDIRVNPKNPDHVYKLSVGMHQTFDGGLTWNNAPRGGSDHHAMWINPENPDHIILGWDQGMGVSFDGGRNYMRPDNLPVGQFVTVDHDFSYPYNVYGGLQDNGSVMGPSTKRGGSSIKLEDWKSTGGGDGMYNVVDWENNRYLYNGSQHGPITRTDLKTGERSYIRYPDMDRWAWNHPIVVSPHNASTIYHAGNKVIRSRNRGDSWEEISGDLTTQDKVKIAGIGNVQYCTIVTMEESPAKEGVLWVGTDDGKVWVTPDGGRTWNDVTDNIPGHPGYWVSRVATSNADASTAYVTITGLRRDDFRPFVYKTTDMGKTWKSIASNLPDNESLHVIREHPRNSNLLFVGSTRAVYVSFDGGDVWNLFKNNMPANPVEDLKIHPRDEDIIVATHGRSIYIADIAYMEEITKETLAKEFHLFSPQTRVKWQSTGENRSSSINYNGPSEPVAAHIYYYLKTEPAEAKIQILDGERVIYESNVDKDKGVNRFLWNYIVRPPADGQERPQVRRSMTSARPGTYTVRLITDGKAEDKSFTLQQDHWFDKYY